MAEPDPRTTLVVLTHDRRDEVVDVLARAVELPERPPIIVVDNASRDGTAEALAREFPSVPVVRLAANAGAGRATTPYVAFSDDDTWWDAGALRHAADLFDRHASLALVTARILVEPGAREDPACAVMAESPLTRPPALPGIPVLGFTAGAAIARRHAFLSVGGYEPRFFLGGEEQLVACDLAASGWARSRSSRLAISGHAVVV